MFLNCTLQEAITNNLHYITYPDKHNNTSQVRTFQQNLFHNHNSATNIIFENFSAR